MECEITKMIRVYGIVQGVGFRPTVSRHAMARGIRGSVSNKGPYVEIFAPGQAAGCGRFYRRYREQAAEACGHPEASGGTGGGAGGIYAV